VSTRRDDRVVAPPPTVTASQLDTPPPSAPLPNIDARTHALRRFAQWLSSLRYMRTMAPGQPAQEFAIEPERVFIEQPDSVENLAMPAIGIIPGRGQYLVRGLGGADVDDSTYGIAGPHTALMTLYDYQEPITVEGWGSKISERRSIIAAIEVAMGSYVGSTDLRLVLPEYFDSVATFTLNERENVDDIEIVRGRRRVHLFIQMTVPVVAVAKATPMLGPYVQATVTEANGFSVAGGYAGQAALTARLAESSARGGAAGLAVFRLTPDQARVVARAARGLTVAQSMALTDDYLLALVQVMAAEAGSLETWTGRPPYSPGDVPARAFLRSLHRGGGA